METYSPHHFPIHQQFRSGLPQIIPSLLSTSAATSLMYATLVSGLDGSNLLTRLRNLQWLTTAFQQNPVFPAACDTHCALASAHLSEPVSHHSPAYPAAQIQG